MAESEKDRIAHTADLRVTLDMALSNKRKYPVEEFKALVQSARSYIKITTGDPTIHRSVARAVNGLREFLEVERSESLETSCVKRIHWSASFLLATIRSLMAMSLPAYEPCSSHTVSPGCD